MGLTIAWRYWPEFLQGLKGTMLLSLESVFLGTLLGLAVLPLRLSPRRSVRWATWALVNPFRILPILVLLVWGFYSLPMGLGIRLDAWWVAVLGLGLNMGAFCAEIFRKAVEEVPSEHVEAAQLLGFSRWATMKKVILPLAFRNASIPYLNQVLQTVKLSVLAAMISVREVYHVTADVIERTNRPVEMYTALALLLFVPLLLLTLGVEYAENKTAASGQVKRWAWLEGL